MRKKNRREFGMAVCLLFNRKRHHQICLFPIVNCIYSSQLARYENVNVMYFVIFIITRRVAIHQKLLCCNLDKLFAFFLVSKLTVQPPNNDSIQSLT